MNDLENALNDANNALSNIDYKPFSNKAFDLLKEKVSIYITQLIMESVKNAKKNKMDNVSASHVEKSSDYLVSKNVRKSSKLIGTIGGVFLGATISNVLSMAASPTNRYSTYGIILTVLFATIGSFMIAINFFKE